MIALITFLSGGVPNKNTLEGTRIKLTSVRSMNTNKSDTTEHFRCQTAGGMEFREGLGKKLNQTLRIKISRREPVNEKNGC